MIRVLKQWWAKSSRSSGKRRSYTAAAPRIIPRDKHIISRKQISVPALKVLYRLHQSGYDAYLVGGGVRDLLLGREPKDFDVVTNARPEQVKQLFRSALLIGRRFKLVHVRFHQDIIEVATFRCDSFDQNHVNETSGLLISDNQYGTIDDDIWRRDFTVNALYYNIKDFSVVDYTRGIDDLNAGIIRVMGDPYVRYREDPVRMLRAVRFAAKLGFRIEEKTAEPFAELKPLLFKVSNARLFDESMKLFLGGYAEETFALLHHHHFISVLLPVLSPLMKDPSYHQTLHIFINTLLQNTDRRIAEDKPVTPTYLFAAFLWFPLQIHMQQLETEGYKTTEAFHEAADKVVKQQLQALAIPKRCTVGAKEIWSLQWQLNKRSGRRPWRVLEHPRFRAAYDFLLLRSEVEPKVEHLVTWWTAFMEADDAGREALMQTLQAKKHQRKRRG